MIPSRFPVTVVDFIAYSMRMQTDNGVGNAVISLAGRVDDSRFRKAIRMALDAEPILGCRFVDHWFRPYWQRRTDLDELPLCPVVEGDEQSPAFARFLIESIDPSRDPLFKAMIFRGTTDTICVKGSHAAVDGPSIQWFFPLVIGLYQRLKDEPNFVPTPNSTGARRLNWRDLGRRLTFSQRLGTIRDVVANRSTPTATWVFPEYRGKDAFHGYVMLKLSPERVHPLAQYGRDRQATMTSVIFAGLYLAALKLFQAASDGELVFSTNADLRRFLPLHRRDYALSNMSGPGRFRMDPRRDREFESVLASIRDQLKHIMKDPARIPSPLSLLAAFPSLQLCLESLPFSLIGRTVRAKVRQVSTRRERRWTALNAGMIDSSIAFDGTPVNDIYFLGPLILGPGMGLAFTVYRNSLTLSLGLSGRVMNESVARQFLEQVDRELPFHSGAAGRILTLAAERPAEEEHPAAAQSRIEVRTSSSRPWAIREKRG